MVKYGTAHGQVYNRTCVLTWYPNKTCDFVQVHELCMHSRMHVKILPHNKGTRI